MTGRERQSVLDSRARTFDVICAGDAVVTVPESAGILASNEKLTFRPSGGAVNAAMALAAQGLCVGLATVLANDTAGRAVLAEVGASGVDVDGVQLAYPRSGIVLVRGGARQVVASREEEQPISVPATWGSKVLFLSGMSPVASHGAALCKAARAARRTGTIIVMDVSATWGLWEGCDPRRMRMVLHEADVVLCDAQHLFTLNLNVPTIRAALRPGAVLVSSDGVGSSSASGPFGQVSTSGKDRTTAKRREREAFTVAICSELVRAGHTDAGSGALWTQALERAHAMVTE